MNEHIQLFKESLGVLARNSRFFVLYVVIEATISMLSPYGAIIVLIAFVVKPYVLGGLLGVVADGIDRERIATYHDFDKFGGQFYWRICGCILVMSVVVGIPFDIFYVATHAKSFFGGEDPHPSIIAGVLEETCRQIWMITTLSLIVYRKSDMFDALFYPMKVIRGNISVMIIIAVMVILKWKALVGYEGTFPTHYLYVSIGAVGISFFTVVSYIVVFMSFKRREASLLA